MTTMAENTQDRDRERWDAVRNRDRSVAGAFVYGVITTGVYCRPGCASRQPNRANVRFYSSTQEAEADGLRACQRCKPRDAANEDESTCRYLEVHVDEPLTLKDLGARVGLSPHYLQRRFKAVVGVSPKQFADQLRIERFKSTLRESGRDITGAIFDAGYGSLSRLYEKVDTRVGMTPMEYRGGGSGVEISYATSATPLGLLMVGATDRGVCFIQFGANRGQLLDTLRSQYPKAKLSPIANPPPPLFATWMAELNMYLEGRRSDLRLPVHVRATAFQLMVWSCLRRIPAGGVMSYQKVASAIGRPGAARAVARACASNTVALAIPCHRVIRGTGDLGGYRWGTSRKRAVLDTERRVAASR
jgi:AraC family transcriptional regulator, regulatory protein of adaptative response / methylated-DNA-[protein]-cysteine methyltransferase